MTRASIARIPVRPRRAGGAAILMAGGLVAGALAPPTRADGTAPGYTADPAASRLEFIGVQAGAEFTGIFRKFTASVQFAPDALASSRLEVDIDLKSEDTQDKDRDDTIRGHDVFDVAHFASAHYVTRSIAKTAGGFSAVGALTLHGVTKDVPIDFKFAAAGAGATLTGTAQLKRLDFGVGQGDWKSTEWVADIVKVGFSLTLKPR